MANLENYICAIPLGHSIVSPSQEIKHSREGFTMDKYRAGTRRHAIAQLQASGKTEAEAFDAMRGYVGTIRPWVFASNVHGSRIPKPHAEQLIECRHEIARTYSDIARSGNPISVPTPVTPDPTPEPEITQPLRPKGKTDRDGEKNRFYAEWKRLRSWISETASRTGATPVDSLDTMRPLIAAKAMIDQGISCDTLVYAMTMHWSQATRDQANVRTVDFNTESESLGSEFHAEAGYVRKVMLARQPVMLIGPAGTGKSHLAKAVGKTIETESHPNGLPYGETPMTPGATRGDLLGRHTLDGFVTSQFVEIYSGGGVFNFEEIDASDPSMLIVVNNALASDQLFNSANGQVYDRHADFIPVATANTFGLGADAKYTGREKLDLATIDRFRMGRVLITLDENLARNQIL